MNPLSHLHLPSMHLPLPEQLFLQSQAEAGNSWVYQDQLWNGLCENLGGNLPDEVVGDVILVHNHNFYLLIMLLSFSF